MARPVVFDLYHTLVDGADDERDRVIAEMAVVIGVAAAQLVAAYHASWRDRLVRWDVEETVDILARRLGARPTKEQTARAAAIRRALARRLLDTVSAQTLRALDTLRAGGHRLALLSNATSDTAQAWPQTRLAQRFDVAVFSCEVGIAKPDPIIYGLTAQRLGVDVADCVFVGDGGDGELAGAAGVGMTTFRTTEHNDTDPRWDGRVVTAVSELPILLRDMQSESPAPTTATTATTKRSGADPSSH